MDIRCFIKIMKNSSGDGKVEALLADGNVWIRQYEFARPSSRWIILDS